jgi:hypothetical protein
MRSAFAVQRSRFTVSPFESVGEASRFSFSELSKPRRFAYRVGRSQFGI